MTTKKEKSTISKEQLYAYLIEKLAKNGVDLKPILSNQLIYSPQEQLYYVNKHDDMFEYELEERPIPKGSGIKVNTIQLSNFLKMQIHCEACEGKFLDSSVTINDRNLCHISYLDADDFARDMQAVISKYRI